MEKEQVHAALSVAFGSYLKDLNPFTSETVLSPDDTPMYSGLFIPECYFHPVLWSFMYNDFDNIEKYIGMVASSLDVDTNNKEEMEKMVKIIDMTFDSIRSNENIMIIKVLAGVYMGYIVDKFGERQRIRIGNKDVTPEIRNTVYGYYGIMPKMEFIEKCSYDFPTVNPMIFVNLMDKFGLWYDSDKMNYSIDCFGVPKYINNGIVMPFESFSLPVFNRDFINEILIDNGRPMVDCMPVCVNDEGSDVILYLPCLIAKNNTNEEIQGFSMMRHPIRTSSMAYEFAFRLAFDDRQLEIIDKAKVEIIKNKIKKSVTTFRSSDDLLN